MLVWLWLDKALTPAGLSMICLMHTFSVVNALYSCTANALLSAMHFMAHTANCLLCLCRGLKPDYILNTHHHW